MVARSAAYYFLFRHEDFHFKSRAGVTSLIAHSPNFSQAFRTIQSTSATLLVPRSSLADLNNPASTLSSGRSSRRCLAVSFYYYSIQQPWQLQIKSDKWSISSSKRLMKRPMRSASRWVIFGVFFSWLWAGCSRLSTYANGSLAMSPRYDRP